MLLNHANQMAERGLDNCPFRKRLNAAVSQVECLRSRWRWVPQELKTKQNKTKQNKKTNKQTNKDNYSICAC